MDVRTIAAAEALIEVILDLDDPNLRVRALAEAASAAGATAVAAWRRIERGGVTSFEPVFERGVADALPPRASVRALLSDASPDFGLPGCAIARSSTCALVLGGLTSEAEDAVDVFEALLLVLEAAEDAPTAPSNLPGPRSTAPGADARHDLRNVLTGLLASETLRTRFGGELSPAERAKLDANVEHDWRHAGALAWTALGARARAPDATFDAVVRAVVAALEPVFAAQRVRLACHVDAAARGARTRLDATDADRVLRNLLWNAQQALERSGRAGTIDVRLTAPDQRSLELAVEDDGPGFDDAHATRLFEPGFSYGRAGGTGQGLAIVRALVNSAGGSVRAERLARGGARFVVRVPSGNNVERR